MSGRSLLPPSTLHNKSLQAPGSKQLQARPEKRRKIHRADHLQMGKYYNQHQLPSVLNTTSRFPNKYWGGGDDLKWKLSGEREQEPAQSREFKEIGMLQLSG